MLPNHQGTGDCSDDSRMHRWYSLVIFRLLADLHSENHQVAMKRCVFMWLAQLGTQTFRVCWLDILDRVGSWNGWGWMKLLMPPGCVKPSGERPRTFTYEVPGF